MTVGELKQAIRDLDDDMVVVTSEYNSGYGGLFEADASVLEGVEVQRRGPQQTVLAVGPSF